jgi:hypothetical protein
MYGSDNVSAKTFTVFIMKKVTLMLMRSVNALINIGSDDFKSVKSYFNNGMVPKDVFLYLRK